jgi:hypothetical protein
MATLHEDLYVFPRVCVDDTLLPNRHCDERETSILYLIHFLFKSCSFRDAETKYMLWAQYILDLTD